MQTVAVDLDGVLAQYDGWRGVDQIGDPIPGARDFLLAIRVIPAQICIHTTRTNPDVQVSGRSDLSVAQLLLRVRTWLVKHDLPFDSISCRAGKPLAAAYVDDRAVVCRPQSYRMVEYRTALSQIRWLVENEH